MSRRDPRLDPQPGDVLLVHGWQDWRRTVLHVECEVVTYESVECGTGRSELGPLHAFLDRWRKDCATATVLTVATSRTSGGEP